MAITVAVARPDEGPKSGPVSVGWFLTSDKGAALFDAPERLIVRQTKKAHAKSASRCPAVMQMESRRFVIKCRFDLHIGFGHDEKGRAHLINRQGAAAPVRANKLNELLTLVNKAEWRYPDRPTVQLSRPYCLIADELVHVSQISSFAHFRPTPPLGTIFGDRFPLNVGPRPLMWAFERHEPAKDIILRRGEPLFYCQFEAEGPVQVVKAERTPALAKYTKQISSMANLVNQSFGLFKSAKALRRQTADPQRPRPKDAPKLSHPRQNHFHLGKNTPAEGSGQPQARSQAG